MPPPSQVRGPARFSFIPDFFGNDVLYDARETAAAKVFAPAENFIVNLVEGHAALSMITWPKDGGEEVLLLAEGTGPDRRFTATQVSFNGKSVFVALLAREGTWFEKDLRTAKKDATLVVEGWQPPFPAKWMTLLVKRPAVGAASGIASETLPVPSLPPAGDTPYSDVYVHPHVPSWFSGRQWRLYLETSLTHMMTQQEGRLARVPAGDQLSPRPREADAPGRPDAGGRDARHAGGRPVRVHPRPGRAQQDPQHRRGGHGQAHRLGHLLGARRPGLLLPGRAGGKPAARRPAHAHRRGPDVDREDQGLPRRGPRADPGVPGLVGRDRPRWPRKPRPAIPRPATWPTRIIPIAREMRELWQAMVDHDKPCVHPAEWRMALDYCKDLVRQGAPDLGNRIREFDPQMRGAGEEVDGGMQACRMIVKRIRQEAALAGSVDPAALKLAADIRRRCRDILRNKHYKEGDSVRLGE